MALFSVEEPIANSSRFVLPDEHGARLAAAGPTAVASPGGRKPSRIFEPQSTPRPSTHDVVLDAQRNACQRQPLPGRKAPVDLPGLFERLLARDFEKGAQDRVGRIDPGERLRRNLDGRPPATGHVGGDGTDRIGHSPPPTTLGTTPNPSKSRAALSSSNATPVPRPRVVGAQRCRRRSRELAEGILRDLLDLVDVGDNAAELLRPEGELLFREPQTGKLRDSPDDFRSDDIAIGRHSNNCKDFSRGFRTLRTLKPAFRRKKSVVSASLRRRRVLAALAGLARGAGRRGLDRGRGASRRPPRTHRARRRRRRLAGRGAARPGPRIPGVREGGRDLGAIPLRVPRRRESAGRPGGARGRLDRAGPRAARLHGQRHRPRSPDAGLARSLRRRDGSRLAPRSALVREANLERGPATRVSRRSLLRHPRAASGRSASGAPAARIAPSLATVAPERIQAELAKMLEADRAAAAFRWAGSAGLLTPALGLGAKPQRLARGRTKPRPTRNARVRPDPGRPTAAPAPGGDRRRGSACPEATRRPGCAGVATAGQRPAAVAKLLELVGEPPHPPGARASGWAWIRDAGPDLSDALLLLAATRPATSTDGPNPAATCRSEPDGALASAEPT